MNTQAEAILSGGLGQSEAGQSLRFHSPENQEALDQALRQARVTGEQAVLKLERDSESGPCFAYVAPIRSFADIALLSGLDVAGSGAGFVILFPAIEDTGRLMASIGRNFGLTPAELRVAARLRDGRTLKDVSEELDVSINTVRNQLRAIFDKMGLKRQSDLIRALTELAQVAGAVETVDSTRYVAPPPHQFHRLTDGRRLAYRAYGPASGRPVINFHEGLGASLMPFGSHELASELNLRVYSVERPGFGQSDPHPDYSFESVADDMVHFCDGLGLSDVWLSAVLSGAPSAILTAARLGDRARQLALCSGRPPRPTPRTATIARQFRARLEDNPWVAEALFAIVSLRLSKGLVRRMIATETAHAPADRAFMEANPWAIDYLTSYVSECLAVTRKGPADEMRAFRRAGNVTTEGVTCPIVVWHGEQDQLVSPSDLLEFLGDRATEVQVFPDFGQLLGLRVWADLFRLAAR